MDLTANYFNASVTAISGDYTLNGQYHIEGENKRIDGGNVKSANAQVATFDYQGSNLNINYIGLDATAQQAVNVAVNAFINEVLTKTINLA